MHHHASVANISHYDKIVQLSKSACEDFDKRGKVHVEDEFEVKMFIISFVFLENDWLLFPIIKESTTTWEQFMVD